jgi:hypothetical protein
MILGVFQLAGEQVEVIIRGNELMFRDTATQMITTIQGLKFSKAGVLKEFPDLKNNNEWKLIAINRLKEHMKNLKTEKEKMFYVKEELVKWGYDPKFYQKGGHRPVKF